MRTIDSEASTYEITLLKRFEPEEFINIPLIVTSKRGRIDLSGEVNSGIVE